MHGIERELKLTPDQPELLDRLAAVERLGPFEVTARAREQQRNSFFDTRDGSLRAARLALRRRVVVGRPMALWTLKAEGELFRGIASRPEVEMQLDGDLPPALAVGVLGQGARERGSPALAEQLADALAGSPLPRPDPYLELETDRRLLELRASEPGWEAELALDRVQLLGHPAFGELEIEVELKRGDERALEAARGAIVALGAVRESDGTKLTRALSHLASCHCPPAATPPQG
jgi:inorganic triphosphatase YgiF